MRALLNAYREHSDTQGMEQGLARLEMAVQSGASGPNLSGADAAVTPLGTKGLLLTLVGILVGGGMGAAAAHIWGAPIPSVPAPRALEVEVEHFPSAFDRSLPSRPDRVVETGSAPESPRTRLRPSRPPAGRRDAAPRPLEETELMTRARSALHAKQPRKALKLLEVHQRQFPGGILAEERMASMVLALCELGDDTAANREANRFLERYPHSPSAARLRTGCPSD